MGKAGIIRRCGKLYGVVTGSDGIPGDCCTDGHDDTVGVDECVAKREKETENVDG